jgi:hypothetical protein
MPDVGMPLPSRQTHTSTQEWQSFEIRMRRRRAERCLVRAEVALDAGFEDDARAALDEARRLDWQSPDFDTLKARIESRRAADAAELAVRRRRAYGAAAAVVVLALMAAGFFFSNVDDGLWRAMQTGSAKAAAPVIPPSPPAASAEVPRAAPERLPAQTPSTPQPQAAALDSPVSEDGGAIATMPGRGETPTERAVTRSAEVASPTAGEPSRTTERGGVSTDVTANTQATPPPLVLPATSASPAPLTQAPTALIGRSEPQASTPPAAARVPDLPPAPVAPPPEPRSAPAPAPPADAGVRAVLAQYESAYSALNAQAARAVWPSVDADKLQRAFDGLESQRFSLGRCEIAMNGARARATCQGSATWTPKVGASGTQTAARRWNFDLENSGGAWRITRADAR